MFGLVSLVFHVYQWGKEPKKVNEGGSHKNANNSKGKTDQIRLKRISDFSY